jgi:hypothetical protein
MAALALAPPAEVPTSGFQIFYNIQGNPSLFGKPVLIHILPEPQVTQMPAECRLPFFGCHAINH